MAMLDTLAPALTAAEMEKRIVRYGDLKPARRRGKVVDHRLRHELGRRRRELDDPTGLPGRDELLANRLGAVAPPGGDLRDGK